MKNLDDKNILENLSKEDKEILRENNKSRLIMSLIIAAMAGTYLLVSAFSPKQEPQENNKDSYQTSSQHVYSEKSRYLLNNF